MRPFRCSDCSARRWKLVVNTPWALGALALLLVAAAVLQVLPAKDPVVVATRTELSEDRPPIDSEGWWATQQPERTAPAIEVVPVQAGPVSKTPALTRVDGSLASDLVYHLDLHHSAATLDTHSFRLEDPPRIVTDLMGNWQSIGDDIPGQRKYGVGLVKRVRLARREGKLRVVVDLTDNEQPLYAVDSTNGRVSLTLWSISQAAAREN